MKLLLISANAETINMPVLPLGTACVAASVQHAGHDVQIVDLMIQRDIRKSVEQAILSFSPELIGISVRNIDDQCMETSRFLLDPVKQIIQICRNLTDAPIVLGGAGYSIFPRPALTYLGADIGIQGEGEAAMVMLMDRLTHHADLSNIPGIFLLNSNPQKKQVYRRTLDDFPLPLPSTCIVSSSNIDTGALWVPFQTRRGCAMDCSYCSTATIEGRILRKYSLQTVINGLRRYTEAGFHQFFFTDNTFNLPPSYAVALCDGIISADLNIQWRCILYPWKVNERLVEKMAAAGCKEVSLGFESGSEEILNRLNKKFKLDDVRNISELLRKYGIRRLGFLLLGGPGETQATVSQSLAFADSLQLEAMKISAGIRIYPFTALAQVAICEGIIDAEDDLLFPVFYLAKGLKDWLPETINDWIKNRPHWLR